jgi:hypothetical protein
MIIRLLVVASTALGLVSALAVSAELPGDPVSLESLDRIIARGCGQHPSTDGNSSCTGTASCQKELVYKPTHPIPQYGFKCTDVGAPCGTCHGGTHVTCQGTIDPLHPDLCAMYNVPCCNAPGVCMNDSFEDPSTLKITWSCKCEPLTPTMFGTRTMATIQYQGCNS